ncbi:MAG: flavodoxin family protein [Actinomyces sp.]|nr:MAG: flavodoxin family protein [Actinomyces sp.]
MARLLVVHHTPSPNCDTLLAAVLDGTRAEGLSGVEVVERPALGATVSDVLAADACLLGTPANLGYISGALKHFFDTIYYPCLHATRGLGYGAWIHGDDDTTGAERALTTITTGLGWRALRPVLSVRGRPGPADLEACWELGAVVAAHLVTA